MHVYTSQFQRAMSSLEGQGEVQIKELREGTVPSGGEVVEAEEPDARIDISLVAEPDSNAGLIAAVAGFLIVGVILAAVLGFLFFWTYRAGRRRGSSA